MGHPETQLSLLDSTEESGMYHDVNRRGFFSLLIDNGTEKRQTSYWLSDMPNVLNRIDHTRDTWMTQAEFMRPNRRVVNLSRIGLLFVDLDTYRQSWSEGHTAESLANAVLHFCEEENIPAPSLLIYSGRGIQAKWLLEGTIPRQALPRWNACQRYLVDHLAYLGSDPAAKDASRVLRLIDTVNTKSGAICRVVHVTFGLDQLPIRYHFEYLADMFLPVARCDLEIHRAARSERRKLQLLPGKKTGGLRRLSGRQLAWDRLEDLRTLAQLRGGVREGERMQHLFWRLNFLLLSGAVNTSTMYLEAAALATELDPSWNCRSAELTTLYSKAKAYEAGEKVSFDGKAFSPLYTPKNHTLIDLFQITDNEQRQLRTLISSDVALERDRKRQKERRKILSETDSEYLERDRERQKERRKILSAIDSEYLERDRERQKERRKILSAIDSEYLKRHREREKERRIALGAMERERYENDALSRKKPWKAFGISRATWYRLRKPISFPRDTDVKNESICLTEFGDNEI